MDKTLIGDIYHIAYELDILRFINIYNKINKKKLLNLN